ncbi:uncharacterized protein FOMMEDRAFT_156493 [Fomitiporia mediterranea MF3/22]|uniref:uncharacterized protein n=1 Tax=Fomitiporia mediterranea (strain MF3/22) TaxID=694068 RepID=UPI0004407B51|nr:uncharacterized protein FOMMEDRAFT_156493 [Fomitiporia mediterranea MF3/22]EJD03121.1 hypothetical protein FOMMEDRAFT_156493 [Fomitiporia mediterranea MF3/22]
MHMHISPKSLEIRTHHLLLASRPLCLAVTIRGCSFAFIIVITAQRVAQFITAHLANKPLRTDVQDERAQADMLCPNLRKHKRGGRNGQDHLDPSILNRAHMPAALFAILPPKIKGVYVGLMVIRPPLSATQDIQYTQYKIQDASKNEFVPLALRPTDEWSNFFTLNASIKILTATTCETPEIS